MVHPALRVGLAGGAGAGAPAALGGAAPRGAVLGGLGARTALGGLGLGRELLLDPGRLRGGDGLGGLPGLAGRLGQPGKRGSVLLPAPAAVNRPIRRPTVALEQEAAAGPGVPLHWNLLFLG